MEIEVSGNSSVLLKPGSKTEFGRDSGIVADDKTVSRRHVTFELPLTTADEPKVRFQVIGRNPIWVHDSKSGEVNTFTSTQIGEMEAGEQFCVSAKNPFWFTLRKVEFGGQSEGNGKREVGLEENLESRCELIDGEDLEPESLDISSIDPIKEFGFLVIGHEFDKYPKKRIRDMKDWDWFIEEPVVESEDDEYQKRKKSGRRKRKKGNENDDDEEWTRESEEENDQISSAQGVPKPKYTTRSKDHGKHSKDAGKDLYLKRKSSVSDQKFTEDDDDEADETLGGFIVDDELEQEEEIDDSEDEEEFLEEDGEDE